MGLFLSGIKSTRTRFVGDFFFFVYNITLYTLPQSNTFPSPPSYPDDCPRGWEGSRICPTFPVNHVQAGQVTGTLRTLIIV